MSPDGSSTRCAVFLQVWFAKSSALPCYRSLPTAVASIGLSMAPMPMPQRRQSGREAMRQPRSPVRISTIPSLNDEIAHLRDLDLNGLRARWKSTFRRAPSLHLPRHLLFAVLAYRMQADEMGDLAPDTIRLLKQLANSGTTTAAMRLTSTFDRQRSGMKPGAILTREWNGQIYRVMVLDEGFAWQGKTY